MAQDMQPEAPINESSFAYLEGFKAGLADNYCDIKNPYSYDTAEYKEWNAGWHCGVSNWDMNMNDGG